MNYEYLLIYDIITVEKITEIICIQGCIFFHVQITLNVNICCIYVLV